MAIARGDHQVVIRISEIMTVEGERKKEEENMKSRNYFIVERKRAV